MAASSEPSMSVDNIILFDLERDKGDGPSLLGTQKGQAGKVMPSIFSMVSNVAWVPGYPWKL